MERSSNLIDFRELVSAVPGEGLEELVRHIGTKRDLSPSASGRGPDGGRDLFLTEILVGNVSTQKLKWLVSCKDKAVSGEAVSEADLPSITDKLGQHQAEGFLLVTTTIPGTAAKELLDKLDKSNGGGIYTWVWDKSELTKILLDPVYEDLLKQFFPESYKRVKGLTSLEGAVLSFSDELPDGVLDEVMRLVRPYSGFQLKGSRIWPFDVRSARRIDEVIRKLIIEGDPEQASDSTEEIEFDAFMSMLSRLYRAYRDDCYAYIVALAKHHVDPDLRYNAIQFAIDNYRDSIPNQDYFRLASALQDDDSVEELFGFRVTKFVEEKLDDNPHAYDLGDDLDSISFSTVIDQLTVSSLTFSKSLQRISFQGTLDLKVTLQAHDPEGGIHDRYPGAFAGYIDVTGIHLESARADISSFYE
jgi:hypothetical protein